MLNWKERGTIKSEIAQAMKDWKKKENIQIISRWSLYTKSMNKEKQHIHPTPLQAQTSRSIISLTHFKFDTF